jgi:hypothetical protein
MYKLKVQTSSRVKVRSTLFETAELADYSQSVNYETLYTMGELHLFKKDAGNGVIDYLPVERSPLV